MTAINHQAVTDMYNHYHAKVVSNPSLYTNARDKNKAVLVVLPKELLDFANKGAGHSGFGAGARPVGIRRITENATVMLKEIFSSVESLTAFILSSECDAAEYIASVKERHANQVDGRTTKVRVKIVTAKEASASAEYRISMSTSQAITAIKAAVKSAKTRAETARAEADRIAMLKDFETMTSTDFAAKYQFAV